MVNPFTLRREVLRHGRRIARGCEQLHVGVCHLEERFLDPVGLDQLAVVDGAPEGVLVVRDRCLQVGDSDSDVIDLGELHGRMVSTPSDLGQLTDFMSTTNQRASLGAMSGGAPLGP